MSRADEIKDFLAQAGWHEAQQTVLRADFSTRRFSRLERTGGASSRAVLMDADSDQKTPQFVALAGLLRGFEIAAPEIYASDITRGLVLMEDLGDRNIGRAIDAGEDAKLFYRRAMDVLVRLHRRCDAAALRGHDLPLYGGALFAAQAELFLDAYFPLAKNREASLEEAESFRATWKQALKGVESLPQTLMLRDFMLDNLMDLSGRSIGVLDFQDGGIGPLPYDIASLCEVVRRDSPAGILDEMIDYYHAKAGPKLSKEELRRACRILAAQRHTRILGIIAQRALKTGQRDKLAYAPRIWEYLGELMQDEALMPMQKWIRTFVIPA